MLQSLPFLVLYMMVPATAKAQYEGLEAPFGDKVSERIPSYHRAAPTVGIAGPLGRLGIIEAKAVGFRSILNLAVSTTAAGLDDASMASYALLKYFNVPLSERLPTQDQVAEMRHILDSPNNKPILIYGLNNDQAAAAWTLLRASSGVPAEFALQEGLTAGLRNSESVVRERLGIATRH